MQIFFLKCTKRRRNVKHKVCWREKIRVFLIPCTNKIGYIIVVEFFFFTFSHSFICKQGIVLWISSFCLIFILVLFSYKYLVLWYRNQLFISKTALFTTVKLSCIKSFSCFWILKFSYYFGINAEV